ncbi:hypothetical protein CEXT_79911 [Caerostris extrusa]|uniref:Uncharacterized protein n=1 Tax=Caerostris extrusa TaxID=172846 RepID=A0AAV4TDI0_CAEEX|nr:hypothetical protein CEXT_79911 [Caerostris extrusa]
MIVITKQIGPSLKAIDARDANAALSRDVDLNYGKGQLDGDVKGWTASSPEKKKSVGHGRELSASVLPPSPVDRKGMPLTRWKKTYGHIGHI